MEKRIRAVRKHIAEQIFREIDEALERNRSLTPKHYDELNFKKDYQKIKSKYLNNG